MWQDKHISSVFESIADPQLCVISKELPELLLRNIERKIAVACQGQYAKHLHNDIRKIHVRHFCQLCLPSPGLMTISKEPIFFLLDSKVCIRAVVAH